jgi:hypothetical protein
MKLIRNRVIPFGRRFGAINLFGVLFVKPAVNITPQVLNHETIHSRQMRELLYVPFYVIYFLEWLLRLVQCRGRNFEAYIRISFEREAYAHSNDLGYIKRRRAFAQWRSNGNDKHGHIGGK